MSKTINRLEVRQEVVGYRVAADQAGTPDDAIVVVDEQGEAQTYILRKPKPSLEVAPAGQEYVDPYLFETNYFTSREEYEELSRTARILPRASA